MIRSQLILDVHDELIVDNFAGGGGASTGIEMALGRHVDHAINHDAFALGMHRINHPQTIHHCEDVFDVDPAAVCEGRPVGLAHFSPDCKHFSKAKGGKPLDQRIRGLVLVMLRWAKYGAHVMTMENVVEIKTWGPLKLMVKNGKRGWYPDPANIGRTWKGFLAILGTGIKPDHPDLQEILDVLAGTVTKEECVRGFGYDFDMREIRACDHGSPTIRKRLFMVARRDCRPIVWPEASFFDRSQPGNARRGKPWRTIAECIDWGLPCPSIFLNREEARAARCKRPLAKATRRRIAMGIDRYVLKAKRPFLVSLTHQGGDRVESVDAPAQTITAAHRGEKAVVSPLVTRTDMPKSNAGCVYPPEEPVRTITSGGGFGVIAPILTEHANASAQRNMPADEPLRTQVAQVKGGHFALVSANMMVNNTNHPGGKTDDPAKTVTSKDHQFLVAGSLVQTGYGEREGQSPRALDPEKPVGTVVAGGVKIGAVTGTLVHTAHGEKDASGKKRGRGSRDVTEPMPSVLASPDGAVAAATLVGAGGPAFSGKPKPVDAPMNTQTTENHASIAAASMVKMRGDPSTHRHAGAPDEPGHTSSAGGQHHGVVAASVVRHFGQSVGQPAGSPAPTTTADGGGHTGIIAASMTKFNTGAVGSEMEKPLPTIPAGSHSPDTHGGAATPHGVVCAHLAQQNGGFNENPGHPADAPASSISSRGSQQQVVAGSLATYYSNEDGIADPNRPARSVTTKDRQGLVESHAVNPLTDSQIAGARRVATFLREHGVQFDGEFATVAGYVIVDIGLRMLTPRELFRAQGFPEYYVIDRAWVVDPETGEVVEIRLTKEQQIRMCGNSVCPDPYAAIVRLNVPELAIRYGDERKEMVTA